MRRVFPVLDFLLYSIFIILSFIAVLFSLHQELAGLISSLCCFTGFSLIFTIRFYFWFSSKPTFVTKHGVYVWCNNIMLVTKEKMENAIDFYVENLPKVYPLAFPKKLACMLKDARIEWVDKPINLIGFGWKIHDVAGVQAGKDIKVMFMGSLVDSALFHELHHMVDEVILKSKPDYSHKNVNFWATEARIRSNFKGVFGTI